MKCAQIRMKEVQPASPEFMAEKERQEQNRRAYLLRNYGEQRVWKLQQQAITELAKLRPDLARRHQTSTEKPPR